MNGITLILSQTAAEPGVGVHSHQYREEIVPDMISPANTSIAMLVALAPSLRPPSPNHESYPQPHGGVETEVSPTGPAALSGLQGNTGWGRKWHNRQASVGRHCGNRRNNMDLWPMCSTPVIGPPRANEHLTVIQTGHANIAPNCTRTFESHPGNPDAIGEILTKLLFITLIQQPLL